MFSINSLIAFMALVFLASAQLENLPPCSLQCFIDVLNFDGCGSILDFSCHCAKTDLPNKITPCVQKACPSIKDQLAVVDQVQSVCSSAGHPITLPTPGVTTTAVVTTSVLSTTSAVEPTSTEVATSVATTTSVLATSVVNTSTEVLVTSAASTHVDAGETVTEPCTISGTISGTPIVATPLVQTVRTPLVMTKATPVIVTITQCYGTGTTKTCHPVESTKAPATDVTETQCFGTGVTKTCHVSTMAITGAMTTGGPVGTEPVVTSSAGASGASATSIAFNGAGVLAQDNLVSFVALFAAAAYFL